MKFQCSDCNQNKDREGSLELTTENGIMDICSDCVKNYNFVYKNNKCYIERKLQ